MSNYRDLDFLLKAYGALVSDPQSVEVRCVLYKDHSCSHMAGVGEMDGRCPLEWGVLGGFAAVQVGRPRTRD